MSKSSLKVLESTHRVVENAAHVSIDHKKIEELAGHWNDRSLSAGHWNESVHWSDGTKNTVNAVLLLDVLNFCFWPDPGQPKWKVSFQGVVHDGYMALAAALKRAIEEGDKIYQAERMAGLKMEDLEHIFRGEQQIPMMKERLSNVQEAGRVLLDKYDGCFTNAIETAGGSAVELALLLARDFPSFRDETQYCGTSVHFYKRAQITVVDLIGTFGGSGFGYFADANKLTSFADYKIPQVLESLGVLVYSPELCHSLDRYEFITEGDPREVEIRAGMVWAIEYIRRALEVNGITVSAYELDWFLWKLGQRPEQSCRPYHRTRTIFY